MNLLFSQIEEARKNPTAFKRRLAKSRPFFNTKNFRAYFFKAMKQFHNGKTKAEVTRVFREECTLNLQTQLNFQQRISTYIDSLKTYCDTFPAQGCLFVEARKRLLLNIGPHTITGTVQRFDAKVAGGYRATITQIEQTNWRAELRWPLIQKAISIAHGCPTSEIDVGVFAIEDGAYDYEVFTDAQIAAAEAQADALLTAIDQAPTGP